MEAAPCELLAENMGVVNQIFTMEHSRHKDFKPDNEPIPEAGSDGRDYLEEYMLICKELFPDMERTGNWPWPIDESSNSENLVEFEGNDNDV